MPGIPTSIDEVTPTWLAEATGLPIEAVELEQIGQGIGVSSAVYRARLRGEGCPDTVVVKLPALDEAAVFTSTVLSMYLREVRFFTQLADQAPIRVPRCHHAASDDETSQFVVVMEDLSHLRVVDQLDGMSLEDAERAVDGLAAWHATWWGKADGLAEAGVTLSLGDPIYPAVVPMVFDEGWAKVEGAGIDIPEAIRAVQPGFNAALPGLLADLAESPTTMIHGDFRADNLVFCEDGTLAAFDFQLIGTGSGAYDLAYFTTQSLEVAVADAAEQALFERYCAGLTAGGVPAGDLDGLWERYRKAALFCLVYPIVASRGMDLDDPRQRELVVCMLRRFERAVRQLDLAALL
jgi:aminoglycoside phosphotransferase (APT) family kinase protein